MSDHGEEKTGTTGPSFRISSRPVVSPGALGEASRSRGQMTEKSDASGELPRSYGQPIVVAMARDPESLFVYWDIDWSNAFAGAAPQDRKVYLRVCDNEGAEVNRMKIEPLANSCDVRVSPPRSSFRIEIGYFDPNQMWRSVGASELVSMPPDKIGSLAPGDFALVPFHITFQRLTELFRRTAAADGSLTRALARLQEKASHTDQRGSLTPEEHEIFHAMKASISERHFPPRAEFDRASETRLQKKLERILGFGATSPKSPFAGSSRSV